MALCDYFELVTTLMVTTVFTTFDLQTMVTPSELLFIDWLREGFKKKIVEFSTKKKKHWLKTLDFA